MSTRPRAGARRRMLLVRTFLKESRIHGVGLFAAEPIRRGTVIWRLHPPIDSLLDDADVEALPAPAREQILKYSYVDPVLRRRVLCADDARFMNHDERPNCADRMDGAGGVTIAARDIAEGEELTCDYAAIDLEHVPYER